MRLATPVLRALQASLTDEPVAVMISEADGTVVARFCSDRSILAALDGVALAPGSTYSEAAVGTNGFGLALVDDRATLVSGRDHYSEPLATFTCAGTPVHDPATGQVIGALSLTTWSLRRHDLLMALAAQTAMNIEARLAGQAGAASVSQLDGYLRAIAERRDGTAAPRRPEADDLGAAGARGHGGGAAPHRRAGCRRPPATSACRGPPRTGASAATASTSGASDRHRRAHRRYRSAAWSAPLLGHPLPDVGPRRCSGRCGRRRSTTSAR